MSVQKHTRIEIRMPCGYYQTKICCCSKADLCHDRNREIVSMSCYLRIFTSCWFREVRERRRLRVTAQAACTWRALWHGGPHSALPLRLRGIYFQPSIGQSPNYRNRAAKVGGLAPLPSACLTARHCCRNVPRAPKPPSSC